MKSLQLTIPVLDEEVTLVQQVTKIHDFMKAHLAGEWSILIADNGSKDRTIELGQGLAKDIARVEYLQVHKRGVGLALRTSWMQAQADIVGYMDLDTATDLKHLVEAFELLNTSEAQIVNGSRLKRGAHVENRTMLREITSRGFNFIVKTLLRVSLTDGMCGFKFFDREVAQRLIKTGIDIDGWFFSTEMLVKATWQGIPVHEIPVHWTDDQSSKVNVRKLSSAYFKEIMRLRAERTNYIRQYGGS